MRRAVIFTYKLALWVIALCLSAMAFTYLTEYMQSSGFFGDRSIYQSNDTIDMNHKWGTRHYWWQFMCILLFLISILRIIVWVVWYWNDEPVERYTKPTRGFYT